MKRKSLATGAAPTENLPLRSYESKPKTRRPLVRQNTAEACSTSEGSPPIEMSSGDLISDERMRKKRYPNHGSALRVTTRRLEWNFWDYTTHRRRMDSATVVEFLEAIRDAKYVICEGLCQDEHVQSIDKDPDDASHMSFSNSDVIPHSIPNKIEMDSNFGVLVVFRFVDCQLLLDREVDEEQVICDPCKKLQKNVLVQQNRKKRFACAPAKAKAPLTACSSEKLRATVVAMRLECKQLRR